MEGQSITSARIIRIRSRIPSADLSPEALVARLLWAFKGSGRCVSWEDYKRARGTQKSVLDIDRNQFEALLLSTTPDPGFLWRDHPFRPDYRDAEGREYEVLAVAPDQIDLVRDDGVTGTSSHEELRTFFLPIIRNT